MGEVVGAGAGGVEASTDKGFEVATVGEDMVATIEDMATEEDLVATELSKMAAHSSADQTLEWELVIPLQIRR